MARFYDFDIPFFRRRKQQGNFLSYKRNDFAICMSKYKFADAILSQIQGKIFEALSSAVFYNERPATNINLFASFDYIVKNQMPLFVSQLFINGVVGFDIEKEGDAITGIRMLSFGEMMQTNGKWLIKGEDKYAHVIYSTNYLVQGKSDYQIIKDLLQHADDVMNAANTTTKRLGAVVFATPPNILNAPGNITEKQRGTFEKEMQNDYGMLSEQKQIAILSRPLDFTTISLSSQALQLEPKLQTAFKLICGFLKVPYDIFPISGQSTYDNQEQALMQLYLVADEYCNMFVKLANSLGLVVSYELTNRPQINEQIKQQAKQATIAALTQAVQAGLLTREEARKELDQYYILDTQTVL